MQLDQQKLTNLQWWAFLFMVLDHAGAWAVPEYAYIFRGIGRWAFPLFAWVFAYRLLQTQQRLRSSQDFTWDLPLPYLEQYWKLILSGLVAIPAFFSLDPSIKHANIMFSFLCFWMVVVWERQAEKSTDNPWYYWAGWLALVGWLGVTLPHVDYEYGSFLLMICFYSFHQKPTWSSTFGIIFCLCILSMITEYTWAWMAPAVGIALYRWSPTIPRGHPLSMYILYPMHLYMIAPVAKTIRALM
jgi:hypothetical protein